MKVLHRRDNLRERATAILMAELQPEPDWLTPSKRCNKNCRQGRACDCVPHVEEPEETEQSPFWRLVCILFSVVIVVSIGVGLFMHFRGIQ